MIQRFVISAFSTSALKTFLKRNLRGIGFLFLFFVPSLEAKCDRFLSASFWVSSSRPYAKVPENEFWIYHFSSRDYGVVTSKGWFGIYRSGIAGGPVLADWNQIGIQTGLEPFVSVHRYPRDRLGEDFFQKLLKFTASKEPVESRPDGDQILGMISHDILNDLSEGQKSQTRATSLGRLNCAMAPIVLGLTLGAFACFYPMSITPGLDGKPGSLLEHGMARFSMHRFDRAIFQTQLFDFWDSWAQAMYLERRGESPRDLEREALTDLANYREIRSQISEARRIWIFSDYSRLTAITQQSQRAIDRFRNNPKRLRIFLMETLPSLEARVANHSNGASILEADINIEFNSLAETFSPGLPKELWPKEISVRAVQHLNQSGLFTSGMSPEAIESLRFRLYRTPVKGLEEYRIDGALVTWGNIIYDRR